MVSILPLVCVFANLVAAQNKAIINDFTTATMTVTPGQPAVTPTIAAPSYSVYQSTETTVVDGVTRLQTINPKIVNDITIWVTVTAEGSASSSASSSASATEASSASSETASSASASSAISSSSEASASTHTIVVTDVVVSTVYAVSTIYE